MIQDDAPAGMRNRGNRPDGFFKRFAGDEPSGEAMGLAKARNPIRNALFRREPEDQIA
jgi:hypothetical protein